MSEGRQTPALSHYTSAASFAPTFLTAHEADGTEAVPMEASPPSRRSLSDSKPTSTPSPSPLLRHISTLSLLAFGSIWGTLVRLGLSGLFTYTGSSIFPLFWSQLVGTFIMGLLVGTRSLSTFYAPGYTMGTTGFCGSVTTFSSWVLEVFRAFGDQAHYGRDGGANVLDALTQTLLTLLGALGALSAGTALAKSANLKLDSTVRRRSVDAAAIGVGAAVWAAAAALCAGYPPYRHVTFALLMAPPGAIGRWYLARLNASAFAQRHAIPLGTLAANLLATAVICAAFIPQHVGRTPASFPGGSTGCQALHGLQEGFCGCLSTISTFAVELRTIAKNKGIYKATRYAVISWVAGVLICVLLIGSTWWSIGMDGSCLNLV